MEGISFKNAIGLKALPVAEKRQAGLQEAVDLADSVAWAVQNP